MKTQRSLDKPALSRLNPVSGDLHLEKSDLIGFAPGVYVEKAAQLPAVFRTQPQPGTPEGRNPDSVPAVMPQTIDNGQLGARSASIDRELGLAAPDSLQAAGLATGGSTRRR